jgi:hypothetical protein
MTCAEFEQVLPEIVDGGRNAEQEAHLSSCAACASVVADLHLISQQAEALQASEEPNPRVWRSIAATLGQWQSEMDLISEQARLLQASEEPSPRVWNSIQATLEQWQSEMDEVAAQASLLQDSEEPSPRVWNSLEIALRQEGLIRQPRRDRLVAPGLPRRWSWAWLAPVAAVLLVMGGTVYQRGDAPAGLRQMAAVSKAPVFPVESAEDLQMLDAVSLRAPAMRATYETNLRNVNSYIRDAEQSVKSDPNDEEAQESLVNAYAQKSMIYEMALDRSLP